MSIILIFLVLGILIPVSMERVGRLLRTPSAQTRDRAVPYESGIEAEGDTWQPQFLRYYFYALTFVLFDAETAILFPWADAFHAVPPILGIQAIVFVGLLLFGLVYVWKKGVLRWM
ncbi:MAG: NADH-quinone oxidoreductase subunit A [Sulfobacillus thermosulfidooxidans]|uniref:NADH-quinone oxidoreductase subunit n=1 Tax=Sulfobacillus thermosulfidooxidans TaxID=28034 RepID=A0A2T2WTM6_SULTH|nr:MAG: NADH-quinone oxidoreductase subunit A [Sulfobacillus thermosulfidooxidans]